MTLSDVKNEILKLQNPKRKAFDEKLDPSLTVSYGLTMPQIREIAKSVYKDDPYTFLNTNDHSSYEFDQIHAMLIGMLKDINEALIYMKSFIPHVHGWAVNDTLCGGFKLARKHRAKVYEFLTPYFDSDKEFEQRVVSVIFLAHFLEDDYIDQVIEILDKQKVTEYYAKMGVAWAVATILAKYPEKGLAYMKNNHLDKWTYNKSIQKAIESFRVTDELKDILRSMRKK